MPAIRGSARTGTAAQPPMAWAFTSAGTPGSAGRSVMAGVGTAAGTVPTVRGGARGMARDTAGATGAAALPPGMSTATGATPPFAAPPRPGPIRGPATSVAVDAVATT